MRLLILDEPTAALSEQDSDALPRLMLELKTEGVTQIIISHKLNEIPEDRIVRDMVGRDMAQRHPTRARQAGPPLLEVRNWSVRHPDFERLAIRDVSFPVREGEVVGVAGLMGPGARKSP